MALVKNKRNKYLFNSAVRANTRYGLNGNDSALNTTALRNMFSEWGSAQGFTTMYIAPGIYWIDDQIDIIASSTTANKKDLTLLGHGMSDVVFKWVGPTGKWMFYYNGCTYSSFSGFTMDGNGVAGVSCIGHHWDGIVKQAVTHLKYDDVRCQDAEFGIRMGRTRVVTDSQGTRTVHFMDAEVAYRYCEFARLSKAGVSIESYNALDHFIRACRFYDCYIGITNNMGGGFAGNYHAYQNIFYRSLYADATHRNNGYFAIRRNQSFDSKAFYVAENNGSNGSQMAITGNIVLNPVDEKCVRINAPTGVNFTFNTIKSRANHNGPCVEFPRGIINEGGNVYTVPSPYLLGPTVEYSNNGYPSITLPRERILETEIPQEAAPEWHNGPVIEVSSGSGQTTTTNNLRNAVSQAAALNGQAPAIHLKDYNYTINGTLDIPDCDLRIVGEGYKSAIRWGLTTGGTMLRMLKAERIQLDSFFMHGNTTTTGKPIGIEIAHPDEPNKYIFLDFVDIANEKSTGIALYAKDLQHTIVECLDLMHKGGNPSVMADNAEIRAYGGASSNSLTSYDVRNGGKLMITDLWYEAGTPVYLNLTNLSAGEISISCIKCAPTNSLTSPMSIIVDNAPVKLTLQGINMGQSMEVKGDGTNTKVLYMNTHQRKPAETYTDSSTGQPVLQFFTNTSPNAKVLSFNHFTLNSSNRLPEQGVQDSAFIGEMMRALDFNQPFYCDLGKKRGLLIHKVMVQNTLGIHIRGGEPSTPPPTGVLQSVVLTSANSVSEGSTIAFTATANYSDGTTKNVTSETVFSSAEGSWQGNVLTIPPNGVVGDGRTLTVTGVYLSVQATRQISIIDTSTSLGIETVFRETFYNSGTSAKAGSTLGYAFRYGATATVASGSVGIDPGKGSIVPINAGYTTQTETGFWYNNATKDRGLLSTSKYALDRASKELYAAKFYIGHANTAYKTLFAVKVGTSWYAYNQEFSMAQSVSSAANFASGAQLCEITFDMVSNGKWRTLTVTDNTELSLGAVIAGKLPDGNITEHGLYFYQASANNIFLRVDTIEITMIDKGSSTPVSLTSVSIGGPSSVNEGASIALTATAHYSDGSTQNVTAQTAFSEPGGRISGSTLTIPLNSTAGDSTSTIVSATFNGQTGTRSISIVDTTTVPAAPGVIADDTADTLQFTHALGASELLYRVNNGTWLQYTGTISIGNVTRAQGYIEGKVKSAPGRAESAITPSPAFNESQSFSMLSLPMQRLLVDPMMDNLPEGTALNSYPDKSGYLGGYNLTKVGGTSTTDMLVRKNRINGQDSLMGADGTFNTSYNFADAASKAMTANVEGLTFHGVFMSPLPMTSLRNLLYVTTGTSTSAVRFAPRVNASGILEIGLRRKDNDGAVTVNTNITIASNERFYVAARLSYITREIEVRVYKQGGVELIHTSTVSLANIADPALARTSDSAALQQALMGTHGAGSAWGGEMALASLSAQRHEDSVWNPTVNYNRTRFGFL